LIVASADSVSSDFAYVGGGEVASGNTSCYDCANSFVAIASLDVDVGNTVKGFGCITGAVGSVDAVAFENTVPGMDSDIVETVTFVPL
jgi:hypothetical protein